MLNCRGLLRNFFLALFTFAMLANISGVVWGDDPFLALREGYRNGDAKAAAMAYSMSAVYIEKQGGKETARHTGREAIERVFAQTFVGLGGISAQRPADLNFRIKSRARDGKITRTTGLYRLRVAGSDGERTKTYFGNFETIEENDLFVSDTSWEGTREEFESLPAPVLFEADSESLDAEFYNQFLGHYQGENGEEILLTRSMRRLFMLEKPSWEWRALRRVDGTTWTAGKTVLDESETSRVVITRDKLTLSRDGATNVFHRQPGPSRESVMFRSGELWLGGTIYRPEDSAQGIQPEKGQPTKGRPGIVLVHGSGPQDRHGYASIMDLLAVQLAGEGFVVLAYDKRGIGESKGEWQSAGFPALAADASAGMKFLAGRSGVNADCIGLGGSSQAGWVIAEAIRQGSDPKQVLLLGAAGAAMTVEEQNLYNTRVRMEAAGIEQGDITLALEQQTAFFAARRDPAKEPFLLEISQRAKADATVRDWFFPDKIDRSASREWYDVLDPDFDPLPIWRNFKGRGCFIFGSLDDSTPTAEAVRRLELLAKPTFKLVVVENAQHLGLLAPDLLHAEMDLLQRFHPDFWPQVLETVNEQLRQFSPQSQPGR
jgi:pimeloyl-ACP methyl ester carboxylesterase